MLDRAKDPPVVVVAPDHRREGTNALLVCPVGLIEYEFGPESRGLAQVACIRPVKKHAKRLGVTRNNREFMFNSHHALFNRYGFSGHFACDVTGEDREAIVVSGLDVRDHEQFLATPDTTQTE